MKDLLGSPGTVTGLLLRIGQSLFAAGSIGVMVSALGFSNFTAYCDYDCSIEYHPGKANVVANALSRNVPLSALSGQATEGVEVMFANLTLRPQLLSQIREAQSFDEDLKKLREVVGREGKEDFSTDSEGVLLFKGRLCVPNQGDLQTELLKTAHKSRFSIHPGGSKIPVARRRVLKLRFGFWSGNMVEKSEKRLHENGWHTSHVACYLIASMGLQVLWSSGLACLDIYALWIKRDIRNPVLVSLFVVGDWVTATLSLAAACSSAGIAVLYAKDLKFCTGSTHLPCDRFELSIALAFVTWFLIAMSSHVMFWVLASV